MGQVVQRSFITLDEKMDLQKFAPCKYVVANMSLKSEYMAKMVNFKFAYQKQGV